MKKKTIISLLLLSTLSVTPAFANFFSNPRTNTMLNIGSAPSPTPDQLRAIGDSNYGPSSSPVPPRALIERRSDLSNGQIVPSAVVTPAPIVGMRAIDVEYKPVFGTHGERLGTVLAFDENAQLAELQLSTGVAISMPATLIAVNRGGRLMAATVSHDDVLAMAKTQTGHIVATNVVLRSRSTRA